MLATRFVCVWLLLIAAVAVGAPAMAQDSLSQGLEAFDKRDYAAAERLLDGLDAPAAKAVSALAKAATGRCEDAEPDLAADYEDAKLRRLTGLGLARCLVAAQRFAAASQRLGRLELEFPDDLDVLYENARLHLKAWNGSLERMFERAPASFRVNQLSAEIFEIQGRYDEAVAEYRKALQKSPRTLNLHYRLRRALLFRSHESAALDEARQEFEAELNAYDAVAHYQIAQILEVQGQQEAAGERLEHALDLDPDFAEALTALARYRSRADQHAEAIELLERVLVLTCPR
jgi:tetratricopeptide (TPR) repeat protein